MNASSEPPSSASPVGEAPADGAAAVENLQPEVAAQPSLASPLLTIPPIVEVRDLDWKAIESAVNPQAVWARMRDAVERVEMLLDRENGPGLLFDGDRKHPLDHVIQVSPRDESIPLWIIGDLHGDLLALEAALAYIGSGVPVGSAPPRIIFLGDFIDDEGLGLEVLVRLFELIAECPERICVIAGNHDEALSYDGRQFASSVSPSDFADFLNAHLAHEWIERAGKLAIRLTAHVPRALFFPDGLLVAHGGFPLVDLHPMLAATGDWNDPKCLVDFVWSRAHPKARRKMPNRFSRGSQFGYEDFADFCALSTQLGRPITHMVRGHDHVDERYAIYPAYHAHPLVTTVALSRRLNRERFGSYERAPTLVRVLAGSLPQVHQLYPPAALVERVFPPHGQADRGDAVEGARE